MQGTNRISGIAEQYSPRDLCENEVPADASAKDRQPIKWSLWLIRVVIVGFLGWGGVWLFQTHNARYRSYLAQFQPKQIHEAARGAPLALQSSSKVFFAGYQPQDLHQQLLLAQQKPGVRSPYKVFFDLEHTDYGDVELEMDFGVPAVLHVLSVSDDRLQYAVTYRE